MEGQTEWRTDGSKQTEDQLSKTLEKYTAAIPSSGYLAVAVGAMAASLALQLAGRGKWGNFIAQWVPTWLVIGLYTKSLSSKVTTTRIATDAEPS